MMKPIKQLFGLMIISLMFYHTQAQAQVIAPWLTELKYSSNVDYVNDSPFALRHNAVVLDEITSIVGTGTPANIRELRGSRIDGYHEDAQGFQYYSFDTDTRVNGAMVLRNDVIRCALGGCASFSYYFDASSQPLEDTNINAFTLDPENGDLIFSIEAAARIDGSAFLSSDLIRFNSVDGFSLEFDGLALGVQQNIDAVTLLPNSYFLISLVNDGRLSTGLSYFDHWVLSIEPNTGLIELAYTPLFFGEAYNQVNMSSLMAYENDLIFKNGFE